MAPRRQARQRPRLGECRAVIKPCGDRPQAHGVSDETGQETVQSNAATVAMARIVKELGVPATIVGKMVATPPDQLVWLTVDDLRSMDTKMFGKPMQLSTDQPTTSQLCNALLILVPKPTHLRRKLPLGRALLMVQFAFRRRNTANPTPFVDVNQN
jgi:hypothetical protein